jgi:hypothetical protein
MFMDTYLYRFRSLKYLLGDGYEELRSQSIYFSALPDLNDPMEGFRDTFWNGDEIVWTNLVRHYVQCLCHAYLSILIFQNDKNITWDMIPLRDVRPVHATQQHIDLLDDVLNSVFSHAELQAFVQRMAERSHDVRRNELEFYLSNVHALAIPCISEVFQRRNLHPPFNGLDKAIADAKKRLLGASESARLINLVEEEHSNKEHATEQIFASMNNAARQISLIDFYNGNIDRSNKNKNFVFFDFPEGYIQGIEQLVYPVWYTACFTKDCHNSAVWGTYGDRHQGVCLKFKIKNNEGRLSLKLNRVCGWGSAGPSRGAVQQSLVPVEYKSKFVTVDFFRSLGSIPIMVLNRDWYRSKDGRVSVCDFGGDFSDERRKEFWDAFERSASIKLSDWAYEQEYRFIHFGHVIDYSDPKLRVANYDFVDLEGIIFGMNTREEDKLAIMKVIEQKCVENKRDDFKFYQAYYSSATGRIETAELGLLKVSLDKKDESKTVA